MDLNPLLAQDALTVLPDLVEILRKPRAGAWLTTSEMPLPMLDALFVLMVMAPLILKQQRIQPPWLINALAKRATTETAPHAQRAPGPTLLPQDPPALQVALVLPKQHEPLAGAWPTSTEMPLPVHALLVLMAAPLVLKQQRVQPLHRKTALA
jgi:hypothetical protein